VEIKYVKVKDYGRRPDHKSLGASCFDFYSSEEVDIDPGKIVIIGTGIAVEVPHSWFMEIRPRSGLSSKGIILANSPGTIDSDYRGEVLIILHNLTDDLYHVRKGDRIAQGRLVKLDTYVKFTQVKKLSPTERGEQGLGSTGR
jgi:dUTP pyrophosphatase